MALRDPTTHLDPRIRRLWLVQGTIAALAVGLVGLAVIGALGAGDRQVPAVGVGGVALATVVALAGAVWAPGLRWRHHRYDVLDEGLHIASGWLVRRRHLVPHTRVQTVDTRSGPLERAFGLVEVEIRTASYRGSVTLPGLAPEVAADLVAVLAARAGDDQAT